MTATYTGQVNGTTQSWTGSGAVSVLPGAPAQLSLTPAANPVAPGAADSFHAEAYDAEGNDLGDVTGSTTLSIAPDGSCQANACTAAVGVRTPSPPATGRSPRRPPSRCFQR